MQKKIDLLPLADSLAAALLTCEKNNPKLKAIRSLLSKQIRKPATIVDFVNKLSAITELIPDVADFFKKAISDVVSMSKANFHLLIALTRFQCTYRIAKSMQ